MHLSADCLGCAAPQLGDWDDLFTSALQAGASVYGTQQQIKLQTALASAQRAAELQQAQRTAAALLASQQGIAPPPMPADGYSIRLQDDDALPAWVVPAAIGGGALLLVLLLRR